MVESFCSLAGKKLFSIGAFERWRGECATELAHMYLFGFQNKNPQPVIASHLYRRAIDTAGTCNAMNGLAFLLGEGAEGVQADPVEAVQLSMRAAEGGSVRAMYNLTVLFEKGTEILTSNPAKAAKLYKRAVDEGGHVRSMYNLAIML